ncbi:zf-HC2 domain-containing protein [Yoonia sp. SS1-5]|uniref:Zf-HC2 domain-containing protein n=2 Tax=Yoonia rhodophyticola TaxID=3137370 RepID=A0ABZ3JCU6_9RHOB
MKLHDTRPPQPARCPDAIWELIPWYVNGSLPEDEAATVAAHSETCPDCEAEIARQQVLAKKVATTDPFDAPLARSWDSLRAQIEADATARTPQPAKRSWFAGLHGGVLALMGTVAVACVLVVVQVSAPRDGEFVTLTSGGSETATQIKLLPAADVDASMLNALLAAQGMTITDGPSETGVYTADLPEGADATAIAEALMALSEIDFAAAEPE